MKKKKFVCIQNTYDIDNNDNQVNIGLIIRIVKAINKNEAIGIFLSETKDISYSHKLNVSCFKLNEIEILK